jgi:hypothetical protein
VTANRHLAEDALLWLVTGKLPEEEARDAARHLEACARCRSQYHSTRRIFDAVQTADERGLLGSISVPRRTRWEHWQRPLFPWVPVTSIVAAILVVFSVMFWPRMVPLASASELLDRAVADEHRQESPIGYALLTNGVRCGSGSKASPLLLRTDAPSCRHAARSVEGTAWGSSDPLSAEVFRNWHATLIDPQDMVERLPAAWSIRTSTSTGVLRDARLTLRLDTYHPVELDLHFRDEEEVVIKEDPTFRLQDPRINDATILTQLPKSVANGASDKLEVQAWLLLYALHGDTGWEARVVSDGRHVKVEALVASDERKQGFEKSFAQYPGIQLTVREFGEPGLRTDFFPHRLQATNGAPALAHGWLQEQFQDPAAQAQFVTQTVGLSKLVLGRAQLLEEMARQRRSMADAPSRRSLDQLIAREKERLNAQETGLRSALEPLVGRSATPAQRTISLASAHRLDEAVLKLLFSVPSGDSSTLDEEEKIVRQSL